VGAAPPAGGSGDPNATDAGDVPVLRDTGFDDTQIVGITLFVAVRVAFSALNRPARDPTTLSPKRSAQVRHRTRSPSEVQSPLSNQPPVLTFCAFLRRDNTAHLQRGGFSDWRGKDAAHVRDGGV
jgi:hypothetical protein